MHPSGQPHNQRRKMRLLVLVLILLGNLPRVGTRPSLKRYQVSGTEYRVPRTFPHSVLGTRYSVLAEPAVPAPSEISRGGQRYFAQTAHFLRGAFLDYWQTHGATAVLGLP